ncbi:flavodoxin FldA [Trichothermofontia sp.]
MAKIGLFYGTQAGTTEAAAKLIQKEFGGPEIVDLHNIAEASASDFERYECIIIGCPTWDIGNLQSDWEYFSNGLDTISFIGKKVAYFGAGDQIGYTDNFQDAIGILEEKITILGGITVGYWPANGYDYSASKAVKDGRFVGLAIDAHNQFELTNICIKAWVAQLKQEFDV